MSRNYSSNVSFAEALFGHRIRDQKWTRGVMKLCRFWWSNCSVSEAILVTESDTKISFGNGGRFEALSKSFIKKGLRGHYS